MSSNLARLNAVNSLEFRLLVTMFELHLLKQMNAGADCEGKKVAQSKNVVFTLSEKYSRQIGDLPGVLVARKYVSVAISRPV